MTIDAITRTVTATRAELRNHQTYLTVKERTNNGYHPTILDPPPRRPWNAVTLTRAEARNTQTYEAAKAQAQQLGKSLWIED